MRQRTAVAVGVGVRELTAQLPRPSLADAVLAAAFVIPSGVVSRVSAGDDDGSLWRCANVSRLPDGPLLAAWYRNAGHRLLDYPEIALPGFDIEATMITVPGPVVTAVTGYLTIEAPRAMAVVIECVRHTPHGVCVQLLHELVRAALPKPRAVAQPPWVHAPWDRS